MAVSALPRPLAVPAASPVLPWPYVCVLLAEVTVLGTLVVELGRALPLTYELGWAGAGSMLAMQVYSIRRRVPALRNCGALRTWLDLHIFLGLQGFVFVAYHSVGISVGANLAALNFGLVSIVVTTGIIGRYLHGWVPRSAVAERWFARWTLLHRPLAVLLLGITVLHVLAHFAYAR